MQRRTVCARNQFLHREALIGRAEFASQQQKHPQLQRQRESEDEARRALALIRDRDQLQNGLRAANIERAEEAAEINVNADNVINEGLPVPQDPPISETEVARDELLQAERRLHFSDTAHLPQPGHLRPSRRIQGSQGLHRAR